MVTACPRTSPLFKHFRSKSKVDHAMPSQSNQSDMIVFLFFVAGLRYKGIRLLARRLIG